MKIFYAFPYSGLCDEKYELKKEYKEFFNKLIEKTKENNSSYFLAHERERWGKEYSSDIESTIIDFNTIKKSDLICMVPGIPYSGGVHVEIGWASALGKKINLFLKKGSTYSPMITGLHSLTNVKYFYYENDYSDELIDLIINSIKEEMDD